nr:hypothetical protein CFP56_11111 [Quercus suber]
MSIAPGLACAYIRTRTDAASSASSVHRDYNGSVTRRYGVTHKVLSWCAIPLQFGHEMLELGQDLVTVTRLSTNKVGCYSHMNNSPPTCSWSIGDDAAFQALNPGQLHDNVRRSRISIQQGHTSDATTALQYIPYSDFSLLTSRFTSVRRQRVPFIIPSSTYNMDAASSAINNFISSIPSVGKRSDEEETTNASNTASNVDTTSSSKPETTSASTMISKDTSMTEDVAPAVEHAKVTKQHETREQEVVDKERHQDHYHTTIQPLKDSEVLPEKHNAEIAETEHRNFDHDHTDAKGSAEADRAGFASTTEKGQTFESTTQEPGKATEHVHHHLHETVQPVIEKEIIDPSITHRTIPIKERHQEPSQNHGVTTNKAMSVDEFKNKLDGDSNPEKVVGGDVVSE